jgi:hypothetical protein
MNRLDDLSIILQGRWTDRTAAIIDKFRQAAPDAEIIVSSWPGTEYAGPADIRLVVSADPGPFDIRVDGAVVHKDNLNRQVVSTAAGLAAATRRFSLKWRADFDFDVEKMNGFLSLHLTRLRSGTNARKVVVSSVTTANPFATAGLVFHVSDWFYLAQTAVLKVCLLDRPVAESDETACISSAGLEARGFPFGQFTAEQWMVMPLTRAFIRGNLPAYNAPIWRNGFLRLARNNLLVVDPSALGLVTGKYDYFIYPSRRKIVAYVGHRLSSLTQGDHSRLASRVPGVFYVGAGWLRLKGLAFRTWRAAKDRSASAPQSRLGQTVK